MKRFIFLVLVYIFPEKLQGNITQVVERLLRLTGGDFNKIFIKKFFDTLLLLDDFTRANILGQLTFDQVKTVSTSLSSPALKFLLTHGSDASIDHDSAVNTVYTQSSSFVFFI